jgi:glycosyltransferase involved in cell wall biosynthesis
MTTAHSDALPPADPAPALTIVIPALNEEGSIASTIERCLAARETICAQGALQRVDLVVVSDGSTDRTAELARPYAAVGLIEFAQNRGYGAAIQAGWRARPNELLAFIDADGTCDPLDFAPLCAALQREQADIALGCRLGPTSRMPWVRRLGNRAYALLLGLLSRRPVEDTASGMRVVRRSALRSLLPLPDGLHFTPAMSARALLEDLRVVEWPIRYRERVGRSKLNVLRDGLRFLRSILATTLYVRPARLGLPVVAVLVLAAGGMMIRPGLVYLSTHAVADWLVYRFLLSGLLLCVATLLLTATHLLEQLIAVARGAHEQQLRERRRWWTRVDARMILALSATLAGIGAYLAWPAAVSYLRTQTVTVHWSRVVVAMFCELLATQWSLAIVLNRIVLGVVRQQTEMLTARGGE